MEAIFLDCGAGGPQLKRNPLGRIVPIDVLLEQMDWEAADPLEGPAPTRVLEAVPDDHSIMERLLSGLQGEDLPDLRFISLDTVTIFHQQHIAPLLAELEVLSTRLHDPLAMKHLDSVMQLVFAARGRKDTLVAFRARKGKDAA